MFSKSALIGAVAALCALQAHATIFSTVRGVVHDASHRPVPNATVQLKAVHSDWTEQKSSGDDGSFEFQSIPAGTYVIAVAAPGFAAESESLVAQSGTAPVLHFQLQLESRKDSVSVSDTAAVVDSGTATPATLITRSEIHNTPGADLSNSMRMITDFVPGAYMTHDQLHVRGGHQVTWAIDGVPIPSTSIASSVGPQIDPKDIDALEVQRGGYSAEYGDRTYGVFNVVPRTGFEDSRSMEWNATYGSFNQTNDQVSLGDHTERLAWFGSLNGNRSDYGLETPGPDVLHDRVWGLGGFASLIFNASPSDQLRVVVSSRRDDYQVPNDRESLAAGMNDVEHEHDTLATFSWVHSFSPGVLLTSAPFFHDSRANYDGGPLDPSLTAQQHLGSLYAGAQIALNALSKKHNFRAGVYGFGQHDDEFVRLQANDGSFAAVQVQRPSTGQLEAIFAEEQFKILPDVTLTGGLRATHFGGAVNENALDPRVGLAVQIPRLHWVLRGYYGAYYQAPPLSTVSGPLADYAVSAGLGIIPLHGERDEENQIGIAIPLRGWSIEANSFRMRATNFFDHNPLGESNVFFPVSIAGARIWGEEYTLRSPRLFNRADLSIAYSHQHAEAEGALTGGLTDFSSPDAGYFLLDHDQRHTFHANGTAALPWHVQGSASVYFGSGLANGDIGGDAHLQPHTTVDVALSRAFGESFTVALNALNVANRRFLLDNSQTFGGTHYAEPREIYLQLRYRLHF